jgi:serine/threonine protein kinase/tetratricopeptide (TPR) repeat protein
MSIQTACPSCAVKIKIKDELIGKAVKCPQCGERITIPATTVVAESLPAAIPSRPPDTTDQSPTDALHGADPGATRLAGAQASPPPEILGADEPRNLGGYRILRRLGQGGMGAVYEAEDIKLKRHVALKVMKPEIAQNRDHRDRFLREARTAAKVESDFICPIYRVGEENGVPFIAMPFLKGEPLDAHLKQARRLPIDEVIRIGKEVAQGLSAAHEAGLVHRDIKPANIWLETQRSGLRRAVILDFGLARKQVDDVHITQSGAILGTPAYMSPEQARGDTHVDARTDLFSLGCVLYALCTGDLPFKGATTMGVLTALATHNPTPPHKYETPTPRPLSSLIMRLLAKNADDRPQTALDVIEELREIETNLAKLADGTFTTQIRPAKSTDPTEPISRSPGRTATRRQPPPSQGETPYALFAVIAIALLGCVVTVVGGGAYFFVMADGNGPDPVVVVDDKRPPEKEEKKFEPILLKGTLTREDPLDNVGKLPGRHHKVHLVSLESGQPYLIDLEGGFDTYLRIEDADKKVLQYNDDVCPPMDLNSRSVFIPSKKDTYRLVVTSFKPQETGSYILSVQEAVKVDDAKVVKGRLDLQRWQVTHPFKLVAGSPYTVEVTSRNFDASFYLSGAGQLLAQARGTPGNPARVDFTPADAADYGVTVGQAGQTGEYTLSVQRYETPKKLPGTGLLGKKAQPVVDGPLVNEVRQGLVVRGQLDKQTLIRVYLVKLAAGKSYVIDMVTLNAQALDPYLVLSDADGKKLAEDDDGGGFPNARIVYRAEQAGVYRIQATSFGKFGVGPFLLTVREGGIAKQAKVNPVKARGHAARGDWKAAAAEYARFLADQPISDGHQGFEQAAVLLLSGDQAGYRKLCADMLERCTEPDIRPYHAARACTLAADSVKDPALPAKKAEDELNRSAKDYWSLTERGALAYRAGRFDEAATLFEEGLQADIRPGIAVINWVWLSLVEHRRGKPAEARAWLEKTTKWLEQFPMGIPVLDDAAQGIHLHNWLEVQILRREAEALLVSKK